MSLKKTELTKAHIFSFLHELIALYESYQMALHTGEELSCFRALLSSDFQLEIQKIEELIKFMEAE